MMETGMIWYIFRITAIELKYVPKTIVLGSGPTATTQIFSMEDQAQLFEQYISKDDYLSQNLGKYAEYKGALFP